MMSNTNAAMQDGTTVGAVTAGGGHHGQGQGQASHRNVQFRVSAAQQQQLQQHHHQQQQEQQQQQQQSLGTQSDSTSGLASGLPPKNQPPKQPQQQQQQQQSIYSQDPTGSHQLPPQHSMAYSQQPSSQIYQPSQTQQQQRPPIAPTLQHRLHHSASAGNIAMVANSSNRIGGMTFDAGAPGIPGGAGGNGVGGGQGVVIPKKKDPYATAWRTYSKIAEELNLLNPDGTLYPISKEAILRYLHHQSKRIKSSNLHWYVNGLKKHQENLGFPWDDVRYDDQVVGLLKELTLHPVMMTENGDEDGHHGHHAYGSQPNRQRQSSGGMYHAQGGGGGGGRVGHHYSSSSIDTTQIANLSISQRPHPGLQQQQQYMHQHQPMQQRQPYQQQQRTQAPYNKQLHQPQPQQHYPQHSGPHNQHQHQQAQHRLQQQQQQQQQSHIQKGYYNSAPILMPSLHARTPSAQEQSFQGHTSLSHGSSPSVDSHGLHSDSLTTMTSSSALTKRKRDESGFKKSKAKNRSNLVKKTL